MVAVVEVESECIRRAGNCEKEGDGCTKIHYFESFGIGKVLVVSIIQTMP